MPRYLYECAECHITETVIHGINEVYDDCTSCGAEGAMHKLYTNSFAIKKNEKTVQGKSPVGEITKKYIEENKKILKEEREKALKETHEPS
tara:strand:+ start:32 stop:304 length:273 start_codon:yes stop_codon:yes gene_type:complete